MKTNEQWDSKDNRLGFALNRAIDELEQIVADLPRQATDDEIRQAIRKTKLQLADVMSTCKSIEDEMSEKPINLADFAQKFFEGRRAI